MNNGCVVVVGPIGAVLGWALVGLFLVASGSSWANDGASGGAPVVLGSGDLYEAICEVGHPVLVSGWDLDDEKRFVHFEGPFVQAGYPDTVYRYVAIASDDIVEGHAGTRNYHDSLDEYRPKSIPADLEVLKIPLINAVPGDEQGLLNHYGPWDYEHDRRGDSKRVVYAGKMCVLGELSFGIYFNIEQGKVDKVFKAEDREELVRAAHDLRTYSENEPHYEVQDEPSGYARWPLARDGALDVLMKFVVLRELGFSDEAYDLLSTRDGMSESRRRLASQTMDAVELDVGSLQYQVTGYEEEEEKLEVLVEYKLENGVQVRHTYGLEMLYGSWRIFK